MSLCEEACDCKSSKFEDIECKVWRRCFDWMTDDPGVPVSRISSDEAAFEALVEERVTRFPTGDGLNDTVFDRGKRC